MLVRFRAAGISCAALVAVACSVFRSSLRCRRWYTRWLDRLGFGDPAILGVCVLYPWLCLCFCLFAAVAVAVGSVVAAVEMAVVADCLAVAVVAIAAAAVAVGGCR